MKSTRTFFAVLMLTFVFSGIGVQRVSAQSCNISSNAIVCPGFILGQENVASTFGTFTGSEEWGAFGKAPFPSNGDFPYGIRLQRELSQTVYQLRRRNNSANSPIDANLFFGTTRSAAGNEPPTSRMDFNYLWQNQSTATPTISETNIMTLVGAFSKVIVPGSLALACPVIFPGPGSPCFGRVGIENVNPSYTLDVNGIGRFTSVIVTSDARFKTKVKSIGNGMDVIRSLRGTTYNYVNSEHLENFDFSEEGRRPGFIAQEVEKVLPEVVFTDEEGYKGVDYIGIIPYLVEAVKTLDDENAALRAEMEDLRDQLNATGQDKGAGSLGEMRPAELFQNVPNPFDQETRIQFYLPGTAQNASLIIFDMNGRQLMSHDIGSTGQGSITIGATDLDAGMYIYSLIADGKEIATKRMILTKN